MGESDNLFEQQRANLRRSRILVACFIVFFAWLGFGGDLVWYLQTRGADADAYHHVIPWVGALLSTLGAGLAWHAWRTGPDKVLWSTGATEITGSSDPANRRLMNVVEEMALASGLPRPRVWIVPDDDPNAFATGHDERTANIAVTRGLLETCTRDELQAVIAHELGHVKNLDVRLTTLLAALVGAVALVGDGAWRMMRSGTRVGIGGGGGRGKGRDSKGGGGGPLVLVLLAVWLVSWLVAPFVIRLLALGVSRKREYLADAMSAQFTRNPLALATALEKIELATAPTASVKRGSAHLCIADPLGKASSSRTGKLADLVGTHPPMTDRITRLRAMGYAPTAAAGQMTPAS
ncbi:MAG: M48 family metallopeptidase [Gemmatimonadaceae bacterium]